MKTLITGGLGYIGRVVAAKLIEENHKVIIIDRGNADLDGPAPQGSETLKLPIEHPDVERLLFSYQPDVVFHFAASAMIGNGEKYPLEYASNNVGAFATFLTSFVRSVKKPYLIHSGSSAVYGIPIRLPIDEDHPTVPISWYGKTKLIAEEILSKASQVHGVKYIAFRYFNAVGTSHGVFEPTKRDRLIPRALHAALHDEYFEINGTNYSTPDGTCIRDYVHVADLSEAHIKAAQRLLDSPDGLSGEIFNLGTSKGSSILEVLNTVESVCGKSIKRVFGPARPGDVPVSVASYKKAKRSFGWEPKRTLDEAVRGLFSRYI